MVVVLAPSLGLVVVAEAVVPLVFYVTMLFCLPSVAVEAAAVAALTDEEAVVEAVLLELVVAHLHQQFLLLQVVVVRIITMMVAEVVVPVVEFLLEEVEVDMGMIMVRPLVEDKVVVLGTDLII